jgi:hypothetical protein
MFQLKPLSQADPRWRSKRLGNSQATIGSLGCLLTCMAMVANGFGADDTPETLNEKMRLAGGFEGLMVRTTFLKKVYPKIKLTKRVRCPQPPAPLAAIDESLAVGMPVVVKVDFSPEPGVLDHWVVIYDKQGEDYLIQDPYPFPSSSGPVTLTSVYGFGGTPETIIKDAIWFEGIPAQPRPQPPVEPTKTAPADALVVYVQADQLALRQQPFVTEVNLILRLPLGAKLNVLEEKSAALAKIGQNNQWLEVQTPSEAQTAGQNRQGFVAAWFVSTDPAGDLPAEGGGTGPQPGGHPDRLVVYALGEGLALRTQPLVADSNLIKRLADNSEMIVLEERAQAAQKIGVEGQWLHVQDVAGAKGFVAAWFVASERPEDLLGVRQKEGDTEADKPPAPVPDRLIVRAAEPDLALRSQPVIHDSTLIKRVPLHTEFLVLDEFQTAERKIGVVNQWLEVKDVFGDQGYVAAWSVVKTPV